MAMGCRSVGQGSQDLARWTENNNRFSKVFIHSFGRYILLSDRVGTASPNTSQTHWRCSILCVLTYKYLMFPWLWVFLLRSSGLWLISLVDGCQTFGEAIYIFRLPWRWKQYGLPTRLHGIITQKVRWFNLLMMSVQGSSCKRLCEDCDFHPTCCNGYNVDSFISIWIQGNWTVWYEQKWIVTTCIDI
jgi:hypothetical protein